MRTHQNLMTSQSQVSFGINFQFTCTAVEHSSHLPSFTSEVPCDNGDAGSELRASKTSTVWQPDLLICFIAITSTVWHIYIATFTIDINQMQVNIPYKDPFRSISCMLTFQIWAAITACCKKPLLEDSRAESRVLHAWHEAVCGSVWNTLGQTIPTSDLNQ